MTLSVKIDWGKDGFGSGGDDVTARVRDAVNLSYGRDLSTVLAATASGSGTFELDNRSLDYSPRNTASPLYGSVKPGRPVLITRTDAGTTRTLFVGRTDTSPLSPDPNTRRAAVSMLDYLADFSGQTISTQLYAGLRTGDAIGLVLDACGWTGGRDLDPGATVIPWWWEDGTDARSALEKIIQSEGPPAQLMVGSDGEIIFRDRHHRLTRSASQTSQGTWRAKGVKPVLGIPFTVDEGWDKIVNSGSKSVDVRIPQAVQQVWASETAISLSDGEQRLITVSTTDPFVNAVVPVLGVDYRMRSGTVSASLLRTSGGSTAIALLASGGPAVVDTLQLRASPVPVVYSVEVSASDPESVAEYGARSYPEDLPWCGVHDAQAVLSTTVAQRAWPLPVASARFVIGRDATLAAQLLSRDLSDRVTIIEPSTALNNDFYIEQISHELTGEHDHAVTFGVEAAPVGVSPVLRFDTSGQGFNDGKFGDGLDDPANMFRFDSTSGHRFNEGVFCL